MVVWAPQALRELLERPGPQDQEAPWVQQAPVESQASLAVLEELGIPDPLEQLVPRVLAGLQE